MSLLQFKGRVGPTEILNGLRQARGRKGGMSGATFRFAAGSSPTPGAVALLAAWILSDRQAGGAPQISGDTAVIEALRSFDRSNLLGLPRSASAPAPRTNVVPLIAISDGVKVNEAVDSLCDLVMRHAVEPRAVMPAIEWAANEVTDNVELHASAATPGVFYARIDERRQRLELAVVDQGIGIRQSLASSTPTGSDGEAIAKALQRGVTRDPKIGQGNGLAGTREIVVENGGDLHVWSGNAMFRILAGQDKGYVEVPRAFGTGLVLNFRLDRPIDLRKTFIAGTALDFIGKQAEAAQTAGLLVRDEVISARARAPAAALRRKIMAMLPDLDSPLIIDFAGINGAASSFLDELLGRLAAELGESTFRRHVEVRNMNPLVAQTANVVISQRLHGLPTGSQ